MSEKIYRIVVPPDIGAQRLDNFLCSQIPSLSRTRQQKLIEGGNVLVNGKIPKPSRRIRPAEIIQVIVPEPRKLDVLPEDITLDILYEDDDLLVLNKKAGMVVHPAFAHYSGTLVNALLYHCRELSGIGGVQRPGIVHRLDKDTSGIMVVAKTDEAHTNLSEQFAERLIEREYRALVWGHFRKKQSRIESHLRRSPRNRLRMTVSRSGKYAATNYTVIEEYRLFSLLKLVLETGRTHQIRVHMAYINHPIFGDQTYGGRSKRLSGMSRANMALAEDLLKLFNRPFLHALSLGFTHPRTGQLMRFTSSLPDDMQEFLAHLRRDPLSQNQSQTWRI